MHIFLAHQVKYTEVDCMIFYIIARLVCGLMDYPLILAI